LITKNDEWGEFHHIPPHLNIKEIGHEKKKELVK
jgi:hypothetical protein